MNKNLDYCYKAKGMGLEYGAGSGTWTHESRGTSAGTSKFNDWSRGWPLLGPKTYLAWVSRRI